MTAPEKGRASRLAQGLPAVVSDAHALDAIAALIVVTTDAAEGGDERSDAA